LFADNFARAVVSCIPALAAKPPNARHGRMIVDPERSDVDNPGSCRVLFILVYEHLKDERQIFPAKRKPCQSL
jgi:hypothetical protein